jgi:myosin-crossreactive antigen
MAVGTVSGVDPQDNWQLISSVTASGTSVIFNSLSGYKHIWITGKAITKNTSDLPAVQVTGDTSVGNYSISMVAPRAIFLCGASTTAAQAFGFKMYNIDQSIPHKVECAYDATEYAEASDGYMNAVAITSLTVKNYSGATFTGGTLAIYGIPA